MRDDLIRLLKSFANKAYEGNEQEWEKFMCGTIGLDLCYLNGVKKAIDDGRWRAKSEPIAFIKKVGQTAALNFYGAGDLKDRGLAYVGRVDHGALDPEQRHGAKNPPEYELRFDVPQKQGRANCGPVSLLKFTVRQRYADGYSDRLSHQEKIEYLDFAATGCVDDDDSPIASRVPTRLLLNPDYEETGEDPVVNWDMVATIANLDRGERDVLVNYWRHNFPREQAIAAQPTDEKRRCIQAAWKRMDRKNTWEKITNILRGHPSTTPKPSNNIKQGALRSPQADYLNEAIKRRRLEGGVGSAGPSRFDSSGLPI